MNGTDDGLGPLLEALLRMMMEKEYGPLALHGQAGSFWPEWARKLAKELGW